MSTLEQEIEETMDEPQQADVGGEPAKQDTELFDRSIYDKPGLQIQRVDEQTIDKIRLRFSGSVMLDRTDEADVALYNRLTLGKEVELRCAGKVSKIGVAWTTNRDGDLEAVVGERALAVESVWVLQPEDM